jgi:hypothetical protein
VYIQLAYTDASNISYTLISFFLARFPDKPTNLKVTNIESRIADISWLDPSNTGDGGLTHFRIKGNSSIPLNIIIKKVNKYKLNNLTPYTTYEISVAAGNKHGFGEETITSFTTSEDGKN